MSLAIISPGKNPDVWIKEFKALAPELIIEVYPEITEPEKVEYVFLWQHPEGILSDFPNLKLISSMGAGVDHILRDKSIPENIPIVRIVDEKLTFSMTNYVVMAVLNFHRQIDRYQMNQTQKVWDMSRPELDELDYMGFPVVGFGFSEKHDFQYPYYTKDGLDEFLKKVNVLVCLLPLTPDTENILSTSLFEKCNPNTYLINVARGRHLVEEDLIKALDDGHLSGAMLDVFREEPLPKDHPFWENWKISMTPHIASVTNPPAAAPQVIENITRIRSNKDLINLVNRSKGY